MKSAKTKLQDALATLTEREREVLEQRFGLKDGYARTLEEVASQFEVTRERISQIEAKALRKMRHPTRIRKLEGFIEVPNAVTCWEKSVRPRAEVSEDDPDDVPIGLAELIARNLDDED